MDPQRSMMVNNKGNLCSGFVGLSDCMKIISTAGEGMATQTATVCQIICIKNIPIVTQS